MSVLDEFAMMYSEFATVLVRASQWQDKATVFKVTHRSQVLAMKSDSSLKLGQASLKSQCKTKKSSPSSELRFSSHKHVIMGLGTAAM